MHARSARVQRRWPLGYRVAKRVIESVIAIGLISMSTLPFALALLLGAMRGESTLRAQVQIGRHRRPFRRYRLDLSRCGLVGRLLAGLGTSHCIDWWMVATGRLSLVGPRPLEWSERHSVDVLTGRFDVAPGLACLWLLRRQTRIDFSSEPALDQEYMAAASLGIDAGILLRSLVVRLYGSPSASVRIEALIGGIRLANIEMQQLLDDVVAAISAQRPMRVAFVNPDCVNIAARDGVYRDCVNRFDRACADGIGMRIAGRILGTEICQNVNGTDMFPLLCERLAAEGRSMYLLGARPGVAERTAHWAAARYPGLRIAGVAHGYPAAGEEESLLASIRRTRPDVLLVAMGVPLQEKWLARNFPATGALVGMGVGGLFDFYSGAMPRAPLWVRELGCEWMFRLWQEPRRMWRRYLVGNIVFLLRVFRERMTSRRMEGV